MPSTGQILISFGKFFSEIGSSWFGENAPIALPSCCALGDFPQKRQEKDADYQNRMAEIRAVCSESGFIENPKDKKHYCVHHLPQSNKHKTTSFTKELKDKISQNDFKFQGFYFPDNFQATEFFAESTNETEMSERRVCHAENMVFTSAIFSGDCDFHSLEFKEKVYFVDTVFLGKANFINAKFNDFAYFWRAEFHQKADFYKAEFQRGDNFPFAQFKAEALFDEAFFGKGIKKEKTKTSLKLFGQDIETEFEVKDLVNFTDARFETEANFEQASFYGDIDFGNSFFKEYANFKQTRFMTPRMKVNFEDTDFEDTARFSGRGNDFASWDRAYFNFRIAGFKQPAKVSFRNVILNPFGFIQTDPRLFEFTDVEWKNVAPQPLKRFECETGVWRPSNWRIWNWSHERLYHLNVEREVDLYQGKKLPKKIKLDFYRYLGTACRRLATNSENDNRYDDASNFRYMALETSCARRTWKTPPLLEWLYKLSSGYGEKIRVAVMMTIICSVVIPTILYANYLSFNPLPENAKSASLVITLQSPDASAAPQTDFSSEIDEDKTLNWWAATIFSLKTMTLQKNDLKPIGALANIIVAMQGILAPLQFALLALAVRRRFMR